MSIVYVMTFINLTKVCDIDVTVEERGLCVLLQGIFISVILTSPHESFHEAGALQSHWCFRKAHLTVLNHLPTLSSTGINLFGIYRIEILDPKQTPREDA